jgi:DNA-binding response OmpR family regulator
MPRPLRVAMIDRDTGFRVVLTRRMEELGWEHKTFSSAARPSRLLELQLDAVVVDMDVLGARAWRWVETLSEQPARPSIIVCTESSTVGDRVRALRLGVDDWLSRPCHPEELIARVEAVVRHRQSFRFSPLEPIRLGEVEIRLGEQQAFVARDSINLTRREFQVFELLARNSGVAISRESIYEHVWLAPMSRDDRSVDVVVHKVRRKLLAASSQWRYLHTSPGIGYGVAPVRAHERPPAWATAGGHDR